ncbi:UDP-2,4-diacetamido-2,4,6-trideoxy-beta-L-altropyranose hydrolase [Crateriforma spongiae]|uniref:UDP-2,4-diacetamido-2,4, 6-trideoxy-beta-L-altropyranose hydrolase n=1 Tax=Crateriforma spongiae TaxID=2724528 RepID=UPI0039AF0D7A
MNVLFRVDSGLQIGSGHVARCLTLADALARTEARCTFVCRPHSGHLIEWIESQGFPVRQLPFGETLSSDPTSWLGAPQAIDAVQTRKAIGEETFDWLITDHYAIDRTWQRPMRQVADRIMAVDDLADRFHDADVLLDQNFQIDPAARYFDLLPEHCAGLYGPGYALLRSDFAARRPPIAFPESRSGSGSPRRVMLFMGGMDAPNVTGRVLRLLMDSHVQSQLAEMPTHLEVVAGSSNPHLRELGVLCDHTRMMVGLEATLRVQVADMAGLMRDVELAIASGGSNTWERCCMGLPTATIAAAENQVEVSSLMHQHGASRYLGRNETITDSELIAGLREFLRLPDDEKAWLSMSQLGMRMVDGLGARRVAETLRQANRTQRRAA